MTNIASIMIFYRIKTMNDWIFEWTLMQYYMLDRDSDTRSKNNLLKNK